MQETLLYKYWEHYASTGQTVCWKQNTLKIITSGRLNEHQGPDYQGARYELNGVLYQGAVEMHISIDDWFKHQHHYDPAYRDVQLHVLLKEPAGENDVYHLQHSDPIPAFVLPVPKPLIAKNAITLCRPSKTKIDIEQVLQKLALNRLQNKVHVMRKKLKVFSAEQLFYHGYLKALGYPYNKHIFEWLAYRVSLEQINKYKKSPIQLLALYLGLAGFLNSDFQDSFARSLKKTFEDMSGSLSYVALSKRNWQFAAVRPRNHPQFRLAGWVALISLKASENIFELFFALIQQRAPYAALLSELQEFLTIETDNYWQQHYALEKPNRNNKNKFYIGQERIKEIILNLLIPLNLAMAHQKNNYGFISYLEDFYLTIPGRCIYKSIFRRRPWLMEYIDHWPYFTLGQAFIELEEGFCRLSNCSRCPLNRKPF